MIQDGQVRRLKKLLSRGMSLGVAALKSGMSEKTARKYRRGSKMPSGGKGKLSAGTQNRPVRGA